MNLRKDSERAQRLLFNALKQEQRLNALRNVDDSAARFEFSPTQARAIVARLHDATGADNAEQ